MEGIQLVTVVLPEAALQEPPAVRQFLVVEVEEPLVAVLVEKGDHRLRVGAEEEAELTQL